MKEIEGTILSKGYDENMTYDGLLGNANCSYFIVIDTSIGKRLICMPYSSNLEQEIKGLDKLLEAGDTISFKTGNPEQPMHWKHPKEVMIKKPENREENKLIK